MKSKERFVSLDLCRGIAAIGVVFFHAFLQIDFFAPLFLLVDFFFVLSGFVLEPLFPRDVRSRKERRRFLYKRIFRFFPMTIAAVSFALLWGILVSKNLNGDKLGTGIAFILACFLLQIVYSPSLGFNNPLWSLSAEWLTNLLAIPLLSKRRVPLIVGGILLGYVFLAIGYFRDWSNFEFNLLLRDFEGIGRACVGFFLGVLLRQKFEFLRGIKFFCNVYSTVISLIIIYVSMLLTLDLRYISIFWTAPLFAFTIIYFANINQTIKDSKLLNPAIVLGNLSFGIYVWQDPGRKIAIVILEKAGLLTQSLVSHTLQFILILAISIVFTLATQTFVERPLRRFLRERRSRALAGYYSD